MKIQVNMGLSTHQFRKQNLVTIMKQRGRGSHDVYKCELCGLQGKSVHLGLVDIVTRSKTPSDFLLCPKVTTPKFTQIKIVKCYASGPQFENLTPGSIHNVVETPPPYKNDGSGVWVMGIGEPVKVLNNEFTRI